MTSSFLGLHLESPLPLVLAVSFLAVLGALRVMATWVEQEQEIHDLKVRSHELRLRVMRRMAQREGLIPYDDAELGEVEVLEADDPAAEGAVEVRELPPPLRRPAPKTPTAPKDTATPSEAAAPAETPAPTQSKAA